MNYIYIYRSEIRMSITTGKLIVITGPMFSGKTSRLIEFLERHTLAGRKVILFKPDIDGRYSETDVVTHKGIKLPATLSPVDYRAREFITDHVSDYEVVGLDEAQFWKNEAGIPELLENLALERKIVYASALNRDHFGNPFSVTSRLLGYADEIFSLTAVCAVCGGDAIFTQRIINGKPAFGEIIRVGGKDLYEPRCRNCFVHPSEQSKLEIDRFPDR